VLVVAHAQESRSLRRAGVAIGWTAYWAMLTVAGVLIPTLWAMGRPRTAVRVRRPGAARWAAFAAILIGFAGVAVAGGITLYSLDRITQRPTPESALGWPVAASALLAATTAAWATCLPASWSGSFRALLVLLAAPAVQLSLANLPSEITHHGNVATALSGSALMTAGAILLSTAVFRTHSPHEANGPHPTSEPPSARHGGAETPLP